MSKRTAASSSKGAIPKGSKTSVSKPGGIAKPQKGKGKPGTSGIGKGKKEPAKQGVVEWQLPAFSVPPPKKKDINWEKLKKETARRHAPEGEDIKEIRRILKEVKGEDIPVHEFINMVGPYTFDNGTELRSVMAEDLESFRTLAKKVYETMTQDISDVLVNEQLQMVQYYEEKSSQLGDKMMRAINEIYEMAPKFEFERFLDNRDDYLQTLFPMPRDAEVLLSDEASEMMRRQQAYHRLQWLKSEGERMSEENKRLMRRLEELKREQQLEQNRAADLTAEAETKRQELAQEENQMKETLEKLNESIEKSFIRDEVKITKEHNKTVMEQASEVSVKGGPSTGAIRRTRSGTGLKKPRPKKKQEWSSTTAADIEEETMKSSVAAQTKKSASRTSIRRPKGARAKSPHFSPIKTPPQKPPPKQASPFHFSPPKTPPREAAASARVPEQPFVSFGKAKPKKAAKPPSPFHYSPPKSPPQERGPVTSTQVEESSFSGFGRARPAPAPRQTSPFHYSPPRPSSPPQVQETRIEASTTTVQQKRPQPRVRQGMAPRDTWGGFY